MNTQSDAPWKGQLPLHFCFLLATNFFKWAGRQLWENASKNYSHLFFILKFKLQKVLGEGGKERLSWMGMCIYIYIYTHVHHLCCLWWWYSHSATENAFLHALSCFLLYLNLPHSIPSIQWFKAAQYNDQPNFVWNVIYFFIPPTPSGMADASRSVGLLHFESQLLLRLPPKLPKKGCSERRSKCEQVCNV